MRHIYRASFARFTVVRESLEKHIRVNCAECSNVARYEYCIVSDGGSRDWITDVFCSASCCKAYHGLNKRWGEL